MRDDAHEGRSAAAAPSGDNMIDRSRFARLGALVSTTVAGGLAAALLVAAPAVQAEGEAPTDAPVRVLRPNAVRGAALAQLGPLFEGPLAHGFLGVTYSRQFHEYIAAEFTVGQGGGGGRRGPNAGAGLRFSLGGRDRGAFTVSPGGHVAFLDGYGPVGFGQMEIAWELRTRSGLDLVIGGGPGVTLTTSRKVERDCEPFPLGCKDERFHGGDTTLHLRLELGYAF